MPLINFPCYSEALKYLSFPTQTLAKCGKMIPVMLLGYFLHKKKYGIIDWSTMVAVTIGSAGFLVAGVSSGVPETVFVIMTLNTRHSFRFQDISPSFGNPKPYDTPLGLSLLVMYLFFDGFTSTSQEKLFKSHPMSSSHQMFFVGVCSALISVFLLLFPLDVLITTGKLEFNHLGPALSFSLRHPALIGEALILSVAATTGQALIYFCIKEYGALVLSTGEFRD
jgi:hypothetical protein